MRKDRVSIFGEEQKASDFFRLGFGLIVSSVLL